MAYMRPSQDLGGFREVIDSSALAKTLRESHALNGVSVVETPRGVRFGQPGVAISFQVIKERWLQSRSSGQVFREIREIKLVRINMIAQAGA
ncbi:MAG: hypothetical protein JWN34_2846 [Bryobacterales bacterium]|nr:hypothetical protein [Bryobacterales bacterium]